MRDVRTVLMNKARNSFPDEISELNESSRLHVIARAEEPKLFIIRKFSNFCSSSYNLFLPFKKVDVMLL